MRRNKYLFIAAIALSAGCIGAIDPPAGYVRVGSDHDYDAKFVSARGNVLAMKSRSYEDRSADLKFWTEAVEYQKVDLDGMKLAGRESIKSKVGVEGVLFNFESGEGRGKSTYLVALYVTPMRIYTIEATGPTDSITQDLPKLKESMQSVR